MMAKSTYTELIKMTIYKHKMVDTQTGKETIVDCNADEIAEIEAGKIKADQQVSNIAKRAADKAALLSKMGLTADEAKLLLS